MSKYDSLTPEQLCSELENRYAFKADAQIPKQTLIDQLVKLDSQYEQSAVATNEQAVKDYNRIFELSKVPIEPLVQIRFTHRDGDREIKFRYFAQDRYLDERGVSHLKLPVKGKGQNKQWAMKPPLWHFLQDQTYSVPYSIYEHLNSRIVPDAVVETDPDTQQEYSRRILRRRMSAELHMSREQVESIAVKKGA